MKVHKFPNNEKLTEKQGELLPPGEVGEYYDKKEVDQVIAAINVLQTEIFKNTNIVTTTLKITEGFHNG